MLKKILFLGGSTQQLPALKYAKEQGYYTILCDYLIDNPGQFISDEFYCVSTTDKDAILEVAREANIDGIVAYASDPAASTAAYVGNILNLPSNPYESVRILVTKDLFREFLKKNGFNTPKAAGYTKLEDAISEIKSYQLPVMIKPVDSSGSKGVSKVEKPGDLSKAFQYALENSKSKTVIMEEYIEMAHEFMIGGDAFVHNGRVNFSGFLNCHRDTNVSPYVPVGKSYPCALTKEQLDYAILEINRVLHVLNMNSGALNIEMMYDKHGELYIIEIGPRNGGNMIPDLLKDATGVDLVAATIEAALGNEIVNMELKDHKCYYAIHVLHSNKTGILESIEIADNISSKIYKRKIYKKAGEFVEYFDGANKALGILFLEFESYEEMNSSLNYINQHIKIMVKE